MASEHIGRRAVVVGAGMGGLAAAGALADFFERVIVVERDHLPADDAEPVDRSGTPQSKHIHALLAGGERALGELFPGFASELAAAGAVSLRGTDFRVELPGFDPFPQRELGWSVYSMSRPLLEQVTRRRVRRLANVELRGGCQARELLPAADGAAVVGVRCERGAAGRDETLSADLVVDASGRGGLTLGLLEALGRPQPEEEAIGVDIGYATAIFAIPDGAPADWKGMRTLPQPPETRIGGLLLPLENDRWMVTLGGRHDDKPPGDADGFLATAQQLRTPTLYNAIRHAKRLGGIARFGFPASTWRHFERLPNGNDASTGGGLPRGLLPLGDAVCRFNPVWGQGMSVAAQEGLALRRALTRVGRGDGEPLTRLAAAFFADIAELIETPWTSAAIPDFANPKTVGQRPPDLENRLKFARALNRLAAEDAAIHRLTAEVANLLKPASALRDPELVAQVEALMVEA
jgi:2-polyprenyl-6-methoxyphenol hydroxylase-like FAD-dependent oxidoreductase